MVGLCYNRTVVEIYTVQCWFIVCRTIRHATRGTPEEDPMTKAAKVISRKTTDSELQSEYKWGFVTDIEEDRAPKGLSVTQCR